MTTERPKIVVFGGSGFVGQEICRISRSMGHRIISVSRHGEPDIEERWVKGVEWIEADVFAPDSWSVVLEGAEAVIDCIGAATGASGVGASGSIADAAELIADHSERAKVASVVYISCAHEVASAGTRAMEARGEAESTFEQRRFATSILRPAFISGREHQESTPDQAAGDRIGGDLVEADDSGDPPALRRELVAICALRAALEADIEGILEIDDIAHLGDAMFIQ